MLVGERMSHPIIALHPDTPLADALALMKHEHIRRAPVIKDGRLVGIVSEKDLLHASPSEATSLSIWELHYLLSKLTIDHVMTRQVLTVSEDTPLEEAARIMADNKVGGLPVLRDGHVIGIITETDLFKVFLELMGARAAGVRITALVTDEPGQLAKLTQAIADIGGNIISLGTFAGEDPANFLLTCKVAGPSPEQLRERIAPLVERVVDMRVSRP